MTHSIKSIKDDIIEIFEEGGLDSYGIKTKAAKYIMDKTGLKKTAAKDWAKKIHDECLMFGSVGEESDTSDVDETDQEPSITLKSDLEFEKDYVYNKEEDIYLFLLEKRFGKNIKLNGDTVRSIIKSYSNFDGQPDTINQVAIRYNIPRNILIYILKVLGHTHDALPITNEEFQEKSDDELLEQCVNDKKFALYQKLQKEDWNTTKKNSRKWDEFIVGKYNPFLDAIDNWSPPTVPDIEKLTRLQQTETDNTFLCVLTDTHIGELTKDSWEGKTFNTEKAVQNIISYIFQIEEKLLERKNQPTKCKLVIMGDILNSFVDGMTRRGTQLHNDVINAELYRVGLDVIITFVDALKQMFNELSINCVKGNHDSDLIWAVYYASSRYFEDVENLEWNISNYWLDSFKVNNCYFIYTHGKDDVNHISLPKTNTKKFESFVQSLLLSKVEELVGVKSKYFICGHLHSYEQVELNDFEFIQVPASVDADSFAESLGYRSKARQNCFIVGQNHIEEILHFYF